MRDVACAVRIPLRAMRPTAEHVSHFETSGCARGQKMRAGNRIALSELSPPETRMEKAMPVIFLWGALPVLLIGGGYVVYRVIGG